MEELRPSVSASANTCSNNCTKARATRAESSDVDLLRHKTSHRWLQQGKRSMGLFRQSLLALRTLSLKPTKSSSSPPPPPAAAAAATAAASSGKPQRQPPIQQEQQQDSPLETQKSHSSTLSSPLSIPESEPEPEPELHHQQQHSERQQTSDRRPPPSSYYLPPSLPYSSPFHSQERQSPPPPPPSPPPPPENMAAAATAAAERALQGILKQLHSNPHMAYGEASALLSKAKIALLKLDALTPAPAAAAPRLALARDVYEAGALFSIRARDPDAFTRYVAQLRPFYELLLPPSSSSAGSEAQRRNKVTGLYLLLLLTQGRYAEFHSELEALACREQQLQQQAGGEAVEIENDRFLGYPIKLERWLMEGSYDRVWKAMKSREVPSEEYGVFSEILTSQIRSEIASSSERAYPSLPLSSTKSLLFLDSEGAVVDFARSRGWAVRDGHIYFPLVSTSTTTGAGAGADSAAESNGNEDEKDFSQAVIENTLGYARELETIV